MALSVMAFMPLCITGCDEGDVNQVINNAAAYTGEKADAYRAATELVKEQLDAPSTAIFPAYKSSFVAEGDASGTGYDKMYIVTAYVEAGNAFGGMWKNDFVVNVYLDEENSKWYSVIEYIG